MIDDRAKIPAENAAALLGAWYDVVWGRAPNPHHVPATQPNARFAVKQADWPRSRK